MKRFSLKRLIILTAIIVPIDSVFLFTTDQTITTAHIINVIIIILVVDIVFSLTERKK